MAMDAPDIMEEDCGNTFSALKTVVVVAVATLLASSTTGRDTALMLSAGVEVARQKVNMARIQVELMLAPPPAPEDEFISSEVEVRILLLIILPFSPSPTPIPSPSSLTTSPTQTRQRGRRWNPRS